MKNMKNIEDILKTLKVMYVEDEEDSREILADMLGDYVGELRLASNGMEGLSIHASERIDIIISDILMPKMDGIKMIKHIREGSINTDVPIILATAFSETQYMLDSIRLKCDGYVLKPLDFAVLLDTMHRAYIPRLYMKNLQIQNRLLKTLSTFYGGKKIEIIQYLIEHCDNEQIYNGSIENIADELEISRQTVAKAFQELSEIGLVVKIKNKTYQLKSFE